MSADSLCRPGKVNMSNVTGCDEVVRQQDSWWNNAKWIRYYANSDSWEQNIESLIEHIYCILAYFTIFNTLSIWKCQDHLPQRFVISYNSELRSRRPLDLLKHKRVSLWQALRNVTAKLHQYKDINTLVRNPLTTEQGQSLSMGAHSQRLEREFGVVLTHIWLFFLLSQNCRKSSCGTITIFVDNSLFDQQIA